VDDAVTLGKRETLGQLLQRTGITGRDYTAFLTPTSILAARFAKEAVDRALSFGLEDGLRLERRLFHLSFATGEFQQGMQDVACRYANHEASFSTKSRPAMEKERVAKNPLHQLLNRSRGERRADFARRRA